MQESLTWLLIGVVTATYISQRHAAAQRREPTTVEISSQLEIDPTRWRHTGAQPPHYGDFDGNRVHVRDEAVHELRGVLAF